MKYKDFNTGQFKEIYVKALDNMPIGSIIPFSGTSIPIGYMLCNGAAISRTTFSKLFSIIGTMYGSGDDSTTFNLPNLKGRVPVGLDSSEPGFGVLGETGGEREHTLTIDEIPAHTHKSSSRSVDGNRNSDTGTVWSNQGVSTSERTSNSFETSSTGGGQAHNNLQPYITLNYIIKVENTSIIDSQEAQLSNSYIESDINGYTANYINNVTNNIHGGTTTPATSLGKDGDIYILYS